MKIEHLFPAILIILDIAAGCVYLSKGNKYAAFYWILAAGLSFCAIKMRG
jgi:hypothetical protein